MKRKGEKKKKKKNKKKQKKNRKKKAMCGTNSGEIGGSDPG